MSRQSVRFFLCSLLAIFILSCGYKLLGKTGNRFPDDARGLFIPMVNNKTDEPGLEDVFARILVVSLEPGVE